MHSVLSISDKVAFLDEQKLSWFGKTEDMKHSDNQNLMDFITASEYQINKQTA